MFWVIDPLACCSGSDEGFSAGWIMLAQEEALVELLECSFDFLHLGILSNYKPGVQQRGVCFKDPWAIFIKIRIF